MFGGRPAGGKTERKNVLHRIRGINVESCDGDLECYRKKEGAALGQENQGLVSKDANGPRMLRGSTRSSPTGYIFATSSTTGGPKFLPMIDHYPKGLLTPRVRKGDGLLGKDQAVPSR